MTRLVLVAEDDLVALLDYAQPDEEDDVTENPESDNEHHIVYTLRRLRTAVQENGSPWSVEA